MEIKISLNVANAILNIFADLSNSSFKKRQLDFIELSIRQSIQEYQEKSQSEDKSKDFPDEIIEKKDV